MATLAASGSLTAAWNGTGVAPAGSVVQLTTADATSVGVEITGTFVLTLVLEATMDGSTWFAVNPFSILGVGVSATFTAPGRCVASVADFVQLRARCSIWTSGAAVVTMDGSAAASGGGGSGGGGGAVTIADGANVALGTTTDAAVQGDNPGTVSAKLRGLNKTLVTGIPITSLPALTAGAAVIGAVTQSGTWNVSVNTALPAGANSIGTVVLGAGAAAVGTVALTAGAAVIGAVTQSGTWNVTVNTALPAGANSIGTVVLGAGAAAVGTVALTAGAAVIGAVTQSGAWTVAGTGTFGVAGVQTAGAGVSTNPLLVGGSDGTNARFLVMDTTGRPMVVGAAAAGAAVAGNPVLGGISDGTNAQTLRQAPVASTLIAATGIPIVSIGTVTGTQIAPSVSASAITDGNGLSGGLVVAGYDYNSASFDRHRNNVDVILLASAARTTLQNSANITVYNCKGIIVTVDVTATVSTVSLTPSINYIDPASGKAIPLLTGTTIAASGTFTYWVDEAALASVPAPFTKTAQAALGRIITVNIAVGNANSQTYSVGLTQIP